ncbi:myo-inosose-2 dehydratase [Paenibacillus allorhizosphaerae]|uniref:Inosose dehydratase n=1 Tax=Paenibacillus allorhizosphaerae TaxID=2849866 RepID=A0ABM8VQ42_9BACL|nr:myo-inosose-2 dehydratase [Paenibacillus allorhizosphaerae]CAG7653689.1 Inosose dehydratase [Paenibacillus allorhizosphaerae]
MNNVKYGISAINWVNEDILEMGDHYTAEQVLTDMSSLGYEGTEFCRKFPRNTEALQSLLGSKNMVLTSQWKSVHFTDPSRREAELQAFRAHADFLKAMGCKYVVTCETGNAFEDLSQNSVRIEPLTDEQWEHLVEGLHEAGRYCKDNGMKLVYHYHGETVVESGEEIERLMKSTDPELVHMLYDTGHAYFGGSDPLHILRTYYDRIAYIHLKDVRQEVLDWKRTQGVRFRDAVRKGVFTVPGDGCIDFGPIFRELKDRGYEGWMIIEAEQDPAIADPVKYARKAKEYIEQVSA